MGFWEHRKAFLIGQKYAGGKNSSFDWLPKPLIDDSVGGNIGTDLNGFEQMQERKSCYIIKIQYSFR